MMSFRRIRNAVAGSTTAALLALGSLVAGTQFGSLVSAQAGSRTCTTPVTSYVRNKPLRALPSTGGTASEGHVSGWALLCRAN